MKTYPVNLTYHHIDAYVSPEQDLTIPEGEWEPCPNCKLTPKVWRFDNGRRTACGCWESMYDHHSIHAESIMSVHKRTGGVQMNLYDSDELRLNWNHWCNTGEHLFIPISMGGKDRW